MTKEDRKDWDKLVDEAISALKGTCPLRDDELILEANKYIMKLERDIQNLRNKKRVASLLRAY